MKKGTKIWLIVALIFILAGGGLCIAAVSMGINYDSLRQGIEDGHYSFSLSNWGIHVGDDNEAMESVMDANGNEKVQAEEEMGALQINLDFGKLKVEPTPEGKKDIYLDAGDDAKYFEWSSDGHEIVVQNRDRNRVILGEAIPEATLYVPEGTKIFTVYVGVDAGSCDIDVPLLCEYLEVDVDAGEASVKNIQATSASLDCDAGSILLDGSVEEGGNIEEDAGKIEVNLAGADEKDYNYDINVSMGSLNINGRSFSGLDEERIIDNGAYSQWKIGCDAGSIDMTMNK